MTTQSAVTPRLYRADDGRLVAGVARGVSEHLNVEVRWVRLAFIVLAFLGGAGVMIYGALWLFVPVERETAPVRRGGSRPTLLLSLAAVVVGIVLLLQFLRVLPAAATPLMLVVVGGTLLWMRSDDDQRRRITGQAADGQVAGRLAWPQVFLGAVFVLVGVVGLLASQGSPLDVARVLLAGLIVTAGVAVLAAPWAIALLRDRDEERRARIRSEERADIAAHVHDSVLQTLTLIQRNSADPSAVARLARSQERDLRRWLYEPGSNEANTLRGALEAVVADVEDQHGVRIELVCVADAPLNDRLTALVQASREALVNAAKYAGTQGPISVYAEVDEEVVTMYVRDRGDGFDLDALPPDRRGVRDSILGRMERNGGTAEIHTLDGGGTQVALSMRLTP